MTEMNASMSLLGMTTEIVSAYVSNHQLLQEELFALMHKVHQSLGTMNTGQSLKSPLSTSPAVPIENSITQDYIVCLEDGLQLKMLKRHLKTTYNMTPEEYRRRWDLPSNYPMVAPNYSKRRSAIAKSVGLGSSQKTQKKKKVA